MYSTMPDGLSAVVQKNTKKPQRSGYIFSLHDQYDYLLLACHGFCAAKVRGSGQAISKPDDSLDNGCWGGLDSVQRLDILSAKLH